MASIKDVAKASGVSISTVSYVLNDDPRIPEVTASKVRQIANEIGYLPSAAARNLKKQNTKTILVAISDFGGPVYHELLDGIQHQLTKEGYTMIVSTGISSVNLLKERSADAAIVTDIHLSNELLIKTAKNFGPIILLDRKLSDEFVYHITIDNEQAMFELTSKAITSRKRNKIAYVHGVTGTYDNQTRFQGFRRAIDTHQISTYSEYFGLFTKQSGEDIVEQILLKNEPMPDLFICANDEMAIGIMDRLKVHHFDIPATVGICGFDDIDLSSYVQPQLSTVKIAHREWGMNAALTAVQLIRKEAVTFFVQKGQVIIRDSF